MVRNETVKLQEIVRANGSSVYHVNLPLEEVQNSQLHKGDKLKVKSIGEGKIKIERVSPSEDGE